VWFIGRSERRRFDPLMRVRRDDPEYRRQAAAEAAFWAAPPFNSEIFERLHVGKLKRFIDESYTGDPTRSWLADLAGRGPFARAAALGSTEGAREGDWLAAGGSRRLDVYDISPAVLAKTRTRLARRLGRLRLPRRGLRFRVADLNFVALPRARYDVVWTSASLHHVTNLEYLFAEVERSLRPGGLFAIHDYTGEPRLRYGAERLALANAALARVPERFRLVPELAAPADSDMSPFEAVRSDETLALVRQRFDPLHLAEVDALYPLLLAADFPRLEREEPALVGELLEAERAGRARGLRRCSVYAVFRKRAPAGGSTTG